MEPPGLRAQWETFMRTEVGVGRVGVGNEVLRVRTVEGEPVRMWDQARIVGGMEGELDVDGHVVVGTDMGVGVGGLGFDIV